MVQNKKWGFFGWRQRYYTTVQIQAKFCRRQLYTVLLCLFNFSSIFADVSWIVQICIVMYICSRREFILGNIILWSISGLVWTCTVYIYTYVNIYTVMLFIFWLSCETCICYWIFKGFADNNRCCTHQRFQEELFLALLHIYYWIWLHFCAVFLLT